MVKCVKPYTANIFPFVSLSILCAWDTLWNCRAAI